MMHGHMNLKFSFLSVDIKVLAVILFGRLHSCQKLFLKQALIT